MNLCKQGYTETTRGNEEDGGGMKGTTRGGRSEERSVSASERGKKGEGGVKRVYLGGSARPG